MSSHDSFSWGAETLQRAGRLDAGPATRRPGRTRGASRRGSLLGARAAALLIDGLVLALPTCALVYALSLVFPHRGFSVATGSNTSAGLRIGLPAVLVISALSLSYFFLFEALRGQTIGKRAMGLRVQSVGGGPAGLNAISARTVLRLIDGFALYLLGALVALLSGPRRRRLGDWLGGTVVVRDDEPAEVPARSPWRALAYPLSWTLAVFVAIFALGLGTAAGADEQAVSLVQSYVKARERGDGALACSMLSTEQQRELVAIQTGDYARADAARCPALVLSSDPRSHLLNPQLPEFAKGPLRARYDSAGIALVTSQDAAPAGLVVIFEGGQPKLDVRGVEKVAFLTGCVRLGHASAGRCACLFRSFRADGSLEAVLRRAPTLAVRADERRCREA
jgi:uncharacterized RDD family membrane protein YckC